MSDEQRAMPKGIYGVIISPDGQVVANEGDFDKAGYGGFKLAECQKMRVRNSLRRSFAKAFLYEKMSHRMSEHFIEIFWDNALQHGYRMQLFAQGWTDEEARL